MKKLIFATLLTLLLAPLTGLEAKDKHDDHDEKDRHSRHHDKDKKDKHRKGTKAQLALLSKAVSDINAEIEALRLKIGDLPADLGATLTALQSAIDTNSGDIAFLLAQAQMIIGSLSNHDTRLDDLEAAVAALSADLATLGATIGDLELRVSALELSTPPGGSTVIFSGDFTQSVAADVISRQAWADFKSMTTGSFASIEIRNSLNGSAICADPIAATQIANELNTHVPVTGSLATFACDGLSWNVGACGAGVELNAGLDAAVCSCDQDATVRPLIGNDSWGGVGANFGGSGGTCGAPTQTLEVILTR